MFESQPPPKDYQVSASQLEVFDSEKEGCERKWGWKYIAKVPQETHPSAALGSNVHKILEDYLQHGTYPDQNTKEGQIATSGLHLLPSPGPHVVVEDMIKFRSPAGFLYGGRVDYQFQADETWLAEKHGWMGLPLWVIGDHKTTSNWRWMKTADILRNDTQALVYSAASLLESGDPAVALQWTYYNTKNLKSDQTNLILTVEEVSKKFERLDRVTEKLHRALAVVTDPLDLPANTDTCAKFGGCPYVHLCNISIGQRWKSHMSNLPALPGFPQLPQAPSAPAAAPVVPQATADLMAQLAAMQATANAAPPPQTSVLDDLRARQAAAAAQLPMPAPAPMPPVVAAPVAPIPPAIPQSPAPLPQVLAAPVAAPTPAAGTWYDPTNTGDATKYLYPCHCGQQVGAHNVSVRRDAAGNPVDRVCPNCNVPVPGSDIVFGPVPPTAPNPPEAAQATQTAPVAPQLPAPQAPAAGPPPDPTAAPKAGPGRPKGSKNGSAKPSTDSDGTSAIRAVWAEESVAITNTYGSKVTVGPFEISEFPREGETSIACLARLNGELAAYAEQERARKFASFVAVLPK